MKKHNEPPQPPKPKQTYTCKKCDDDFSSAANYIKHYKLAHKTVPPDLKELNVKTIICDQCPDIFFNREALNSHKKNVHCTEDSKKKKEKPVRACPHCEKTFRVFASWKEHIKVKHEKDTPFKCDQCERAYGTRQRLRTHQNSMHRRVKCDQCGQEVCNSFLLKRHKASKHGIAPTDTAIQCKHCPLYFEFDIVLERHMQKQHSDQL